MSSTYEILLEKMKSEISMGQVTISELSTARAINVARHLQEQGIGIILVPKE